MSEAEKILTDLLDVPSFNRWIKGKANPEEQEKWEKWESEDQLHEEVRKKARMLYNLPFEETRGSDIQEELNRLQTHLNDGSRVSRLPDKARRLRKGYYWAVAAAVVLLLAVIFSITLYTSQQQPQEAETKLLYSTIEVGYGEKGVLKISDGSSIRLNANSSLKYIPEQFNRSYMEVWFEGEAYFSIVRNPDGKQRNFIVHTPDGSIRVLGTRFNVNTRFGRTGVVLEEGSIEISLKDSEKGVGGKFKLKPSQRAQFSDKYPNVQIQEVDTLLYTAWLDGKLVFKELSLSKLMKDIEQIYGITIEVKDQTLLKQKISGSLRNPDLETLIEGLETILKVNIEKQSEEGLYLMERNEGNG